MLEPKPLWRSWLLIPILIVVLAILYKVMWLTLNAVPFNADESGVALMARHILQGERPVFLYNHAYLGSTGAWLVAFSFSIFGQSVLAIRLVHVVLFTGTLITTYFVARRFDLDKWSASIAMLLLAIPPTMLTLYTSVALGGYGETLLLGNILLLLADHRWLIADSGSPSAGGQSNSEARSLPSAIRYLLIGLVAGFGFYTFSLFLIYLIPVSVGLLFYFFKHELRTWRQNWRAILGRYSLGLIGFLIGAAPWWISLIQARGVLANDTVGLAVANLTSGSQLSTFIVGLIDFFVFGLSAFFGLRYPWSPDFVLPVVGIGVMLIYLGALAYAVKHASKIWFGMFGLLLIAFLFTPLGVDPSGRYFLPLYLPLTIFTAALLSRLREKNRTLVGLLLALILGYNVAATVIAAATPLPGITTQFDAVTWIDHTRDQELIDFLLAHDETLGYSNWAATYPIVFLSNERIIISAELPYHLDLHYSPHDNRYPHYTEAVAQASRAFFITTNHPLLEDLIRTGLTRLKVNFLEHAIGNYHIFYGLSRNVRPGELQIIK
jgi:hypothetical protein